MNLLIIVILVALAVPLRFVGLGYSDYIGDEHKAFIEVSPDEKVWDFFMARRKGPGQFLTSLVPYLITRDYHNELAQRIPFSIISTLAVAAFYLAINKLTKNKFIAFVASVLFLLNGFIVGFGRIAQYQNLNLLFSFLSIYFYASLLEVDTKLPAPSKSTKFPKLPALVKSFNIKTTHQKHTLLGTLFFSFSLLSHWDVIFTLPVVIYIFTKYLLNKKIFTDTKIQLLKSNLILGCVLILPFLLPYVITQLRSASNMQYFGRRVEFGHFNEERYELLINLYNPFVAFHFVTSLALLGLLGIKKNYPFVLWFTFAYGVFELFVRKPGTHTYNFVIPALVLAAYGIYYIFEVFPKFLKVIPAVPLTIILGFLYYQSYIVFVDHAIEYPWDRKQILSIKTPAKKYDRPTNHEVPIVSKEILNFTTPTYNISQKLPLFGFPHNRYWNDINAWVNSQNAQNNEYFGYVTNEAKTISDWYMDVKYKSEGGFYAVGIHEPLNFVEDWRHTNIGGKTLVHEIKNEYGKTVVRILRVE